MLPMCVHPERPPPSPQKSIIIDQLTDNDWVMDYGALDDHLIDLVVRSVPSKGSCGGEMTLKVSKWIGAVT